MLAKLLGADPKLALHLSAPTARKGYVRASLLNPAPLQCRPPGSPAQRRPECFHPRRSWNQRISPAPHHIAGPGWGEEGLLLLQELVLPQQLEYPARLA